MKLLNIFTITLTLACAIITLTEFSSCKEEDCCQPPPQGKNESVTKPFAYHNGYLYVLVNRDMEVYFVEADQSLTLKNKIGIDFFSSSISVHDSRLLVMSPTGATIFNLTDPSAPDRIFSTWNFSDCNFVTIAGNFAFVSVKPDNQCTQFQGAVEVWDIQNATATQPFTQLMSSSPRGIAIDGTTLFVVGGSGLDVYDISDTQNVTSLGHYNDILGLDLIAGENVLTITTFTGIEQYDYSDLSNIQFISKIEF